MFHFSKKFLLLSVFLLSDRFEEKISIRSNSKKSIGSSNFHSIQIRYHKVDCWKSEEKGQQKKETSIEERGKILNCRSVDYLFDNFIPFWLFMTLRKSVVHHFNFQCFTLGDEKQFFHYQSENR